MLIPSGILADRKGKTGRQHARLKETNAKSRSDRKRVGEKNGPDCDYGSATQKRLREETKMENRPFSAPISNLEPLLYVSRNSFGIVAISARRSEPELCPESPVSHVIHATQ